MEHTNAKLHAFVTRQSLDDGDYLVGSSISLCGINPTALDPDFRVRVSEVDSASLVQGDVCSKCKKNLDALIYRESIPLSEQLWGGLHEEMQAGDIYAFQLHRKNGVEEIYRKLLISKDVISRKQKDGYTAAEISGEDYSKLLSKAIVRLYRWHEINEKGGFKLLNMWSQSKPIWIISRFKDYSWAFDPTSFDEHGRKIQAKKNGALMSILEMEEILGQCSRCF